MYQHPQSGWGIEPGARLKHSTITVALMSASRSPPHGHDDEERRQHRPTAPAAEKEQPSSRLDRPSPASKNSGFAQWATTTQSHQQAPLPKPRPRPHSSRGATTTTTTSTEDSVASSDDDSDELDEDEGRQVRALSTSSASIVTEQVLPTHEL